MPYSFNIGSIQCHIVSDGQQLIDGGSFFGLVPRVLWERVIQPDEKNRIPAQMRCLLVESPQGLILVDTGQGDKISTGYRRQFGMDDSNKRLEADMRRVGFGPEDVDIVLLTPPARRPLRRQHALERSRGPGKRGRPHLPQRPLSDPAP